jgi:hypothetical protein
LGFEIGKGEIMKYSQLKMVISTLEFLNTLAAFRGQLRVQIGQTMQRQKKFKSLQTTQTATNLLKSAGGLDMLSGGANLLTSKYGGTLS